MKNLIVVLFLFLFNASIETATSPKVTINKCCRLGDSLNLNKTCVAGGGFKKWAPKVLYPLKGSFFNKTGELPTSIGVREESLPKTCLEPELYRNAVLVRNGSLFISEKVLFVNPEDFCVDKDVALVCREIYKTSEQSSENVIKINKCCGPNEVYSDDKSSCLTLSKDHSLFNSNLLSGNEQLDLSYIFPVCLSSEFAIAGVFLRQNLNPINGELLTESGKRFQQSQYCLDHVLNSDMDSNNISKDLIVFTCSEHFAKNPDTIESSDDERFQIYSIGLFISVIFLIATLAVSFLLPNHHVLHWRCQTNYVVCLLFGDFLLAITQISGNATVSGPSCIVMAHLMHFFFLSAFFWLNTMCFNIWWTFRDFRPTSLEKGQEIYRLRIYEVYAWGVPILITTIAAVLDNLPENSSETFLRPRFGENKCWFYGDMEILTYFFGPIGILLCVNVLLFLSTARQLTCGLWKIDDVKSTAERVALGRVCMKLVIVMGVTWIADVVSWAVGGPHYVWYVTDIINALQGVFIFIVVGCQPQVCSALKRFWSARVGRSGNERQTNGPQNSSSSQGMPSIDTSVTTTSTIVAKAPIETLC
ncbi:unnamed protein product [Diamesa tonsa]